MNGHTPRATTGVTVRKLVREDIPHTARVFQEAFNETQQRHYGRPLDIGPLERALGIHHSLATHSKVYGVVACKEDGTILGSNFLDQRSESAAGVGPLSVDISQQGSKISHRLMQAVIEKSQEDGHESIRLIQETPNLASFTLLAKLGFEPKDQLNFFMGRCAASWPEPKLDLVIREMTFNDINACAALHRRVVGVDREMELSNSLHPVWAMYNDAPLVAEDRSSHRIVGYATSATLAGHAVGESEEVVASIHFEMTSNAPVGRNKDAILLKVIGRLSPGLVKWALTSGGLELQRNATLMVLGSYTDPTAGVYIPSATF